MLQRPMLLPVLAMLVIASHSMAEPGESVERRYEVPGRGSLVLEVPATWEQDVQRNGEQPPLDLRFSPPGADAVVLVSAIWNPSERQPIELERLRPAVDASIERARPEAVEKEFPIGELRGEHCSGIYFSATDKKPELGPGDYRHMTQGMATLGEVALSFTVLSNDRTESLVERTLGMLERARLDGE